jgi:hypothetical protein
MDKFQTENEKPISYNGRRLGLRSGIKKRKDSATTNIIKNIKHQVTTMPL